MTRRLSLALLGDPVAHSRSPAIHNEALRLAGLEGEYRAIQADRTALERAVNRLRSGSLHGLNVTMPLKEPAAELADQPTPLGLLAGSINTLRLHDGQVQGHSTDAQAFAALIEEGKLDERAPLLVLGAGGSALAVLAAVERTKIETYLSARRIERARELAARFTVTDVVPWGRPVQEAVVVNATPLGMAGEKLPNGLVEAASALVDLPYGSGPTPAATTARSQGITCVDGIEFLTRQAWWSFRWWTDKAVDFNALLRVARNA